MTIDGVELDHNGFDDTTYTSRKVACRYGSGGVKFIGDNVTIQNSYIHDNACQGIWSTLGADKITLVNNRVDDNWDEGIFIDISGNATVQNNEVSGNGFHDSANSIATFSPSTWPVSLRPWRNSQRSYPSRPNGALLKSCARPWSRASRWLSSPG